MSLIEDVTISPFMRPGFIAEIHAEIISSTRKDSLGKARVIVDGNEVASLNRIIYSHFHKVNPERLKRLFEYYSGIKTS
jgi:hypothetical protein